MINENITEVSWKVLPRGDAARWSGMYVTLNPIGKIALSRTTHQRLGSPEAVLIAYDVLNLKLALRPAALDTPNAYPIRKYGTCSGRIIRAYRLISEFGIRPRETVEFETPVIDGEGHLILDLQKLRLSPRAEGWKKRSRVA